MYIYTLPISLCSLSHYKVRRTLLSLVLPMFVRGLRGWVLLCLPPLVSVVLLMFDLDRSLTADSLPQPLMPVSL